MDGDEGLTRRSYSEIFEQLCPYYMSIGMSYDEFWNQDVCLVKTYRKTYELLERRRNQELWLQGLYFYEALCDASPLYRFTMKKGTIKPEPYLKEPLPITEAEVREREEREARKKEERLKAEFTAFAERVRKKMSQETHPE
ncbi:MAG: hypothetical protein J6V22_02515 [Clostridia bacterium]|nr:hypothetical protein [Clostridia bacterium]